MMRQVWINLISNALKFSRGKVEIKISISSRKESGRIVYCIKDNGAGFDMKYYDKLFRGINLSEYNSNIMPYDGYIKIFTFSGKGNSMLNSLWSVLLRNPNLQKLHNI